PVPRRSSKRGTITQPKSSRANLFGRTPKRCHALGFIFPRWPKVSTFRSSAVRFVLIGTRHAWIYPATPHRYRFPAWNTHRSSAFGGSTGRKPESFLSQLAQEIRRRELCGENGTRFRSTFGWP